MQKIAILDCGSQVTQLIGRRLREIGVYCEILPFGKASAADPDVCGIVISSRSLTMKSNGLPKKRTLTKESRCFSRIMGSR